MRSAAIGVPVFRDRGAMAFSLVPREGKFFQEFVGLSQEIRTGALTLRQMLSSSPIDMSKAETIKDLEHACDGRTRGIIDRFGIVGAPEVRARGGDVVVVPLTPGHSTTSTIARLRDRLGSAAP